MTEQQEPTLGILMPEGTVATVPGLMAGSETFPYPVDREVVLGATAPQTADDALALLPLYLDAARRLERRGVDVITANSGLLAMLQPYLARAVSVPVVTSSLTIVPALSQLLGAKHRIGILTLFADAVGEPNFVACGWSSRAIPVSVAGVGHSPAWLEFLRTKQMDAELRRQLHDDLLQVVWELLEREPDIGALVSECTLLPAVLDDIREVVPVPVHDILTTLDWAMSGLRRATVPAVRRASMRVA
jgi:hypothetical protein